MKPLPPQEWDFRPIHSSVFSDALLWEYARESKAVKQAVLGWKRAKVGGKKISEHLEAKAFSEMEIGSNLRSEIIRLGAHALGGDFFLLLINHWQHFPLPWQSMEVKGRQPPHRLQPMEVEVLAKHWIDDRETIESGPYYAFSIFWKNASKKQLLSEFKTWLRLEAKKHSKVMNHGTRAARPAYCKLTWLATLRLANAGYTPETARQFISEKSENKQSAKKSPQETMRLPNYGRSRWYDAITKAAAELSSVETRILSVR